MILGLHHAAIAVPDMQRALDFYVDVVGFDVVEEHTLPPGIPPLAQAFGIEDAGCTVRMIAKGNSYLELFEFGEALPAEDGRPVNRIGITHIALASDDVESDFARLEAAGVAFNAALFGAAPTRFAYGRDPFGNVIELLEHDAEGKAGRRFD